jgi:hypothetical protein
MDESDHFCMLSNLRCCQCNENNAWSYRQGIKIYKHVYECFARAKSTNIQMHDDVLLGFSTSQYQTRLKEDNGIRISIDFSFVNVTEKFNWKGQKFAIWYRRKLPSVAHNMSYQGVLSRFIALLYVCIFCIRFYF